MARTWVGPPFVTCTREGVAPQRDPLVGELDSAGVAAIASAFVWALYAGIRMGRVALGYAESVEQARTDIGAAAARGGE